MQALIADLLAAIGLRWQKLGILTRDLSPDPEWSEQKGLEVALNEVLDEAYNRGFTVGVDVGGIGRVNVGDLFVESNKQNEERATQ